MSALASAVFESLQRLLPPKQSSALLPAVVQALIQALEEGELGLNCRLSLIHISEPTRPY